MFPGRGRGDTPARLPRQGSPNEDTVARKEGTGSGRREPPSVHNEDSPWACESGGQMFGAPGRSQEDLIPTRILRLCVP